MEKPIPEYPTREQLAEVLELKKKYGEEGIRLFLRKQRAEREAEQMEQLKADYPSENQMNESWQAYQENGEAGILAFLKKQRAEREQTEARKEK